MHASDDDSGHAPSVIDQRSQVLGRFHAVQARDADSRKAVGQIIHCPLERQQVGIGVRDEQDFIHTLRFWIDERPVGRPAQPVAGEDRLLGPGVIVEGKIGQRGRRRQKAIGGNHPVEVIVDRQNLRLVVDGLEPDAASVEEYQHHVQERARPEAAAHRELDVIADLPPFIFLLVEIDKHRGFTPILASATASPGADKQVPALRCYVNRLAIIPQDTTAVLRLRNGHKRPDLPRGVGGGAPGGRPGFPFPRDCATSLIGKGYSCGTAPGSHRLRRFRWQTIQHSETHDADLEAAILADAGDADNGLRRWPTVGPTQPWGLPVPEAAGSCQSNPLDAVA